MSKKYLSFLIIYIIFSSHVFSQILELKIVGSSEKETKLIDSLGYQKKNKDFKSLKDKVDFLQINLSKIGFIENELITLEKENDSIFVASLSLKNKYEKIKIYFKENLLNQNNLYQIKQDGNGYYIIIMFEKLEKTLKAINSKKTQLGYPFTKVKLSNIKLNPNKTLEAHLISEIKPQKRLIDGIIIKGYDKFPKSYLRHYLKIKQGQVLDLNEIKRKTRQLSNLNFSSQIKPPEVLFSKNSTSLYIYTQKSQSNSFDGFLGFGTNEETNKLQFDGYLNLNLINNLNYGETFRLQYKSDENDQKTFQTDLTLPYIFKSPIGIDLQLKIFQRDSSFSTTSQFVKLHYQITPKHKISSGLSNSTSSNLLKEEIETSILDYNTNYFHINYQYQNVQINNYLFPINSYLLFEFNFGKRESHLRNEKQNNITLSTFKIFNINNLNSFFIKASGAILNSNTYLENELFRFGGINSIRGFEENSILASQFGILNTEYRYKLSSNLFIHSIIDASFFQNKLLNTKEKLFGYGFGVGILTKSGLLKLNYANGKSENQKFKFSKSKIHISLIANF